MMIGEFRKDRAGRFGRLTGLGMARSLVSIAGAAAAAMLTGCGLGSNSGITVPTAVHGSSFHGSVYGGQQPVVGATIQLYAPATTGYGANSTALITATITSGPGGAFDVTGDYTCPSASTPVYLVASGGNSGYTTNANLTLMAALGACSNQANAFVNINEITTVASVYALAPFMTKYNAVGTSATNATGLANAFADVNLLTNIATGTTPGTLPAGMTIPVAEINTLADIIAACVNSKGGTYNDGSACGTLFYNANPGGTSATAPTDTVTALMNIAQHPATSSANITALYNLATPTSPFQSTLTTAPNDFTLAVTMTGGNVNGPSALAADASGNIFIANAGVNTVTEYSHTGTVLSGTGYTASLSTPSAIAVDANDVVWVTNQGNGTVSRLNGSSGASLGTVSGGGLSAPRSISFDSLGNAWVANSGGTSVTVINSGGTAATQYSPAGATGALAIGVNPH